MIYPPTGSTAYGMEMSRLRSFWSMAVLYLYLYTVEAAGAVGHESAINFTAWYLLILLHVFIRNNIGKSRFCQLLGNMRSQNNAALYLTIAKLRCRQLQKSEKNALTRATRRVSISCHVLDWC